jgi:hypothetical protein
MDRSVTVNAMAVPRGRISPPEDLPRDISEDTSASASDHADGIEDPGIPKEPANAGRGNLGPCLYLGPAGQRCNRPALAGSFCAKHRPGGIASAVRNPSRVLAATGAIVALLWPYIEDLVREIIRWTHSR